MALNRFAIADRGHQKYGELIKKWARDKKSRPANLAEYKKALLAADIEGIFPTGENELQELNIIEGVASRLDVRLPPPHLIDESEYYLAQDGNDYPLPKYYEDVFGGPPNITNKLAFHAARIGDYTVSNCA